MTRLIDANNLFEKVGNIKPSNKSEYELIGKFMNMITYSPTVERPHGEWVQQYKNDGKWHDMGYFDHMYKCSKCGSDGSQRWHFCPNCGADMRKEGEAE